MTNLVLGGYSYYLNTSKEFYENFFDEQLAPLLKLLYENEQYKLTLYMTSAEIDWMALERADMLKLMSILLKRGSISLLSSTIYQSFMPISSAKDISDQIEKMRVKIRQNFRYKPTGFFAFNGIWQSEIVKPLMKSDMSYAVIPTQNQDSALPTSFIMWEHGKKINIIAPKMSNINAVVDNYLDDKASQSALVSTISKNIVADPNAPQIIFFDIDKFVKKKKSFASLIKLLLESYCTKLNYRALSGDEIIPDEISYLPSSCYCKDKNFISHIYENKSNLMKVARINYIENLLQTKLAKRTESDKVLSKIMLLHKGTQFLDGYTSPDDDREMYRNYLEILNEILDNTSEPPVFDMPMYTLDVVKNKNNLFLLDQKCASIREVGDFKTGVDLLSSARLFEDVVSIKQKKSVKTHHSYNQFEVIGSKTTRSFKSYQYHCADFCKIGLEIDKQLLIKNSKEIDLSVTIKNNNKSRIDFTYSLLCAFDNIKDTSTLEKCNTIFNIYLENDKKKAMTFISEPGFYISQMQKNSLLPSWDVGIETGKSFKIDFKITF